MASRTKNISDTLAVKIKTLRLQKNLTQKELSEMLFKSESAVRMWELGKSEPDLETINKLSEIFNVTADYLIGKETSPALSDTKAGKSTSDRTQELKIALFGGETEVTDEMWDDVISYANYLKQKYNNKK